jgi:glucose-1-phosphate cytidylyltransferase
MKVVILAGGLGTRMDSETATKPKPMVMIGKKPILWHIMKIFSFYNIRDFVICTGYKKEVLEEFFKNDFLSSNCLLIEKQSIEFNVKINANEEWHVTLEDTGLDTMTGGRLKKIKHHLTETFCLTYGDTLNNLNISDLISFHNLNKKLATVTACQPPGKFGILKIDDGIVTKFTEKPKGDDQWVNGGFFILEPSVIDYVEDDSTVWENKPLQRLVNEEQLSAFKHFGFYQPMDTIQEKNILENMWNLDNAKWKVWN